MTLRTPPVKPTVLALKQRVLDGATYSDGRTINSVIDDIYGRIGVDPTPDPDPDPEPSVTGLTDEQFDQGGLDGQDPSTLNTSATAITGSGTLTLSDGYQVTGSLGLKLDGTAQHYLEYTGYTSHAAHYLSLYWSHTRNPSADAWLLAIRNGTNSATACQIGVDSTGHLIVRDGSSGGVDDTSTVAFTAGVAYRWDVTVTATTLTVRIYTGTNINSTNTADAAETITCSITSSTFTGEQVGLLSAISGTGTTSGNLKNDTFESGSNGDAASLSNTSATFWGGTSGNCKISTSHPQNGTRGLRIGCGVSAPGYNSGRYDNASHTNHYVTFFLYIVAAGAGNTIIYELRNGAGTQDGTQLVVNSSRQLVIRDAFVAVDTSIALSANTMYRVDITYLGAGDQTLRYYTGANLLSTNTADATETLTGALSATNFSNELIGVIANATGSPDIFIDDFRSDSTALPIGTTAVGIGGNIDRFVSDSAALPAPITTTTPPPTTEGKFIPTTGIYVGATTGTVGTQGGSTSSGLSTYMGITGNIRPHILHFYMTSSTWSGIPTSGERSLLRPTSGQPAIPFWAWKPGGNLNWAQVAAGGNDSAIRACARGLAQYGHPQFIAFFHEPEDNVGDQGTAADFKAMFRHCVLVMRDEWQVRNIINPQVAFVCNFMGYSSHASIGFDDLYPGDDVVDWIGWDPYFESGRNDLGATTGLLNENLAGDWTAEGYDGFYDWATSPHTNFSGAKPLMLCEWGTDFRDFTDAQATTRINQVVNGIQDWPAIKALVYWNSTTPSGIDAQMFGHPLASAAYRSLCELAYCQQTIT